MIELNVYGEILYLDGKKSDGVLRRFVRLDHNRYLLENIPLEEDYNTFIKAWLFDGFNGEILEDTILNQIIKDYNLDSLKIIPKVESKYIFQLIKPK